MVRSLCDAVSLKVGNLSYVRQNRKMIKLIEADAGAILIRKKTTHPFESMMNSCQNQSAPFFPSFRWGEGGFNLM